MDTSLDAATATLSSARTSKRHLPGEIGIWVLIFGDLLAFTTLFVIFMYYRGAAPGDFLASHEHMNQVFGAVNTFILLTSSWFVATGVYATRRGAGGLAAGRFLSAWTCGAAFAVVKYFEYGEKLDAHLTIHTNTFFQCYYMFTGIHLLHVLLGMVMLFLMRRAVRGRAIDARTIRFVESGASFWHMVDLLWIVLFALFYLVR